MSNRITAIVLMGLGALIIVGVFLTGPIHLTITSFGTWHIIGLAAGVVVLLAGLVLSFVRQPRK
jgi:hypothetical protein